MNRRITVSPASIIDRTMEITKLCELSSMRCIAPQYSHGPQAVRPHVEEVNAVRHMLMLPVQVPAAEGFAETHNVVAFLEKPVESDGFTEIIDFLKESSVHYALTVNPIIYTSCIEQLWATAKVQTVNGVRQLQALVDKKRVIVTDSSIRRDLRMDDAEGTDCLLTATIFEELARIGYEKPSQKLTFYKAFFSPQWKYFIHTITQCLSAKFTAWNEFSCSIASLIICLATNQKFNLSKYIFDAMVKHLDGGVKFLMYPHFLQVFINQQLGDMSTHKKIFVNPFHTKKVFANMKRSGKDFCHLTDSTQEAEVSQDETEHEESVPTPSNDLQPSGEDSIQLIDLMVLCTKLQIQVLDLEKAKDAQAKEIAALKKRIQRRVDVSKDQERSLGAPEMHPNQGEFWILFELLVEAKVDEKMNKSTALDDSTAGEVVTTASVKDSAAPTTTASVEDGAAPTTIEEITLAQTRIQIKAAKHKVEPSEFRVPQEAQPLISKDKGKVGYAELIEEKKLARKQEEEANIALIESWENIQAMMEADRLLAERLQSKEREELTDEEKTKRKIFMGTNREKRIHFVATSEQQEKEKQPPYQGTKENSNVYLS
ncbi:hypothetical protein Tco_0414301 [Tanacetum coccineum]